MKILNCYSGIGGNRRLWTPNGNEHEITAIENNIQIAKIYQDFFPQDKVIVADAHQYLLEHFKEFEFIWASPPCPTHSITRFMQEKKVYPDMSLYQEVIILQQWGKDCKWVVENVLPYYDYLIQPTIELHRHAIWSNFPIDDRSYPKMETCKKLQEREFLQNELGFNIDKYAGVDKRKLLRNCVLPDMGLHILNSARKEDEDLFTHKEAK